jgi:teichuronic acid exporter
MSDNLKKETFTALFWSFLERFGTQLIQFGISIILARLLLPKDFGLIAILYVFINLSNTLINSGFGQALVQKKAATFIDECSIFYFNFFIALLTVFCLFLFAPSIAEFFDEPKLTKMTRVLSLALIFNSLGLVQRTLLAKNIDFKTQLKVSLLSIIISALLSISMALNGFGVWSLIGLYLCKDLFNTVFVWFFSSWRPSLIFSMISLKSMFSFGSRLFLVSLLNSVFGNIYQLIIGKFFSTSTLGFYSRADTLYKYPVTLLSGVVSQVTFPVFSKIQDDKQRLKTAVQKSLKTIVLITFPLMVGLVIVAHPLVEVLLTKKWLPSVSYLQLLCVIGMIYPISVLNLNALNAQGRSDLFLKIDIINKILILIIVSITYRFGITAMIIGQIVNSLFSYFLYSYYTGKLLGLTIINQIRDMFPVFSISIVMGLLIYCVKYLSIDNQLLLLITQITLGGLIYISLCFIFKISAFMEVISIVKGFRLSKK